MNSIIEKLQQHTQDQPNKIVYRYISEENIDPITLTFLELDREARKIASELLKVCQKGDRALMLYPAGLEFISAFFACLYAGVVAVPAYPPKKNKKVDRLKSIVEDCDAKIVLTSQETYPIAKDIFERDMMLSSIPLLISDGMREGELFEATNIRGKDLAFLQYTSGSTGKPKGVMVSHSNLFSNLEVLYKYAGWHKDMVGVSWLPHFHDMGLIGGILEPVYAGCSIVLMSPTYFLQKPIRWLETIAQYKANVSGGPNFAYELCVNNIKEEDLEGLNLSSWRSAINGAEPIYEETLSRFSERFSKYGFKSKTHYPCYGMAETTLIITGANIEDEPKILYIEKDAFQKNKIVLSDKSDKNIQKITSCGEPRFGHEVIIVNANKEKLAENEVGEIWAKGSSITQGYWKKEQETKETFHAYTKNEQKGPYLRTGDLGFLHKNELYVCGRMKDIIIIHGKNYYPQEIELTVASSHEALEQMGATAAFSIHKNYTEQLVVMQELKRTHLRKYDAAEIFYVIKKAIRDEYELEVHDIILVKPRQLFRTSSGKIQRLRNKKSYLIPNNFLDSLQNKESINVKYISPETETQKRLLKIFEELLAIEQLGINNKLLDLGINSLLYTQLIFEISNEFGINFSFQILFGLDTIEELGEFIDTINVKVDSDTYEEGTI